MTAKEAAEAGHVPALDGVRGIAIVLVIMFHVVVVEGTVRWAVPTAWIDSFFIRIASTGWTGVDLFFVLSGFLITRILLGAREGEGYFRSFYARRFLRIFPPYYGLLFLLIVILPWLLPFRHNTGLAALRHHQLVYWTYLLNVAASLHPMVDRGPQFSHFWSLAVEEQFYLIWPFIVLVLGRRSLGVFCSVCIIAAPIFRYALMQGVVPSIASGNYAASYTLMPARMDTLAMGGLIAVIAAEPELLRRVARWAIPAGVVSLAALAIMYIHQGGLLLFTHNSQLFGYSAIALTFASFVTIVIGGPAGLVQAACGHRVLRFFGKYSYSLYLIHPPIIVWVMGLASDHGAVRSVWGSYLPFMVTLGFVSGGLSVGAAWLSWHLYERHFLKLKRFVPYGRPRCHGAATRASAAIPVSAEPTSPQPG